LVSPAEKLMELDRESREVFAKKYGIDLKGILRNWAFLARDEQLAPDNDWAIWLLLAGRGFGKSRTGAEFVDEQAQAGKVRRIALVSETPASARDVVIQGESGILNVGEPLKRPKYEPSKRRLTWANGTIATVYSGANPEQIRGPEFDLAWVDELCSFKYPEKTWDNLQLATRLGDNPRTIITTTPKNIPVLKKIMQEVGTYITRGSTYDNRANLPEKFFRDIVARYEGTRLGEQELYANILEDVEGALWSRDLIEKNRVDEDDLVELKRVVVAIDPAVTANEKSDETGIVVAGLGVDNIAYVLADKTCKVSPKKWAEISINAYYNYESDRIIGEANNGGDLIEELIYGVDNKVSYKSVHASRGKITRAEPISALYERGLVKHVGNFAKLEDELCTYVPTTSTKSPNRLDAVVWALTELMLNKNAPKVSPISTQKKASRWRV